MRKAASAPATRAAACAPSPLDVHLRVGRHAVLQLPQRQGRIPTAQRGGVPLVAPRGVGFQGPQQAALAVRCEVVLPQVHRLQQTIRRQVRPRGSGHK